MGRLDHVRGGERVRQSYRFGHRYWDKKEDLLDLG